MSKCEAQHRRGGSLQMLFLGMLEHPSRKLEAELTKTWSCVCCNARLCNLRNLREAIGSGNAADEHPVQQDSAQRGAGSARLAASKTE